MQISTGINSVNNLVALLKEIIGSPDLFRKEDTFLRITSSQGNLAKYNDPSRAIRSTSLNTLKQRCDESLPNGFNELDQLRKKALSALKDLSSANGTIPRNRKRDLAIKAEQLASNNMLLKEELLRLTMLFEKSLQQARTYAEQADPMVIKICMKEQRELLDLFNTRRDL